MAPLRPLRALSSLIVTIAMLCHLTSALKGGTDRGQTAAARGGLLTVKNNFHSTDLVLQCNSPTERLPPATLLPLQAYDFVFDPLVESSWTCNLTTTLAREVMIRKYTGMFVLWSMSKRCTIAKVCSWFAGPCGLSLLPEQGGNPVHVYDWPEDSPKSLEH